MRCGETTPAASGPVGCRRERYWEPEGLPREGQGPFTRHPTGGDLRTELMTAVSRPPLVRCPRWFTDYSASVELQPHTPSSPEPSWCSVLPAPANKQLPLSRLDQELSSHPFSVPQANHQQELLVILPENLECVSVSFSPSLPRLSKNSFW